MPGRYWEPSNPPWYASDRFYYRATRMHSADYAVARYLFVRLSVRPSVCLSHAGILSTPLNIYHHIFYHQVDLPFYTVSGKKGLIVVWP